MVVAIALPSIRISSGSSIATSSVTASTVPSALRRRMLPAPIPCRVADESCMLRSSHEWESRRIAHESHRPAPGGRRIAPDGRGQGNHENPRPADVAATNGNPAGAWRSESFRVGPEQTRLAAGRCRTTPGRCSFARPAQWHRESAEDNGDISPDYARDRHAIYDG